MVPRREYSGQAASPGIIAGPLHVIADRSVADPSLIDRSADASAEPATTPDDAITVFLTAVTTAQSELAELISRNQGDGADILALQAAMLEDEDLIAAVRASLQTGMPVEKAWCDHMNTEIAGFEASDDHHFQARSADLKDVRGRVLASLRGESGEWNLVPQAAAIILATDIMPSRFIALKPENCAGIALRTGSVYSHVALLARANRIPMVVGLGDVDCEGVSGALIDGNQGTLVLSPTKAERDTCRAAPGLPVLGSREFSTLEQQARTQDGEVVDIAVNLSTLSGLEDIKPEWCDGIGLVRTEFLFDWDRQLPDEETQYRTYMRIIEWADGRPVVIRTLDIGGDKPAAPFSADTEANPFLGQRGVRLMLAHEDVFQVQLSALARAAIHGDLRIMIPMITTPDELSRVRKLFGSAADDLAARGLTWCRPDIGMMVEVPAAALSLDAFDADFLSIGSNDLLQYLTASARDNSAVTELGSPLHPGFRKILGIIMDQARAMNIRVGICGDIAGNPKYIPFLLDSGLRSFSVSPEALSRTKRAIVEYEIRGEDHAN